MIKEIDKKWAMQNWDNLIKNYNNANFYQSFSNSLIRNFGTSETKFYIYFDKLEVPKILAIVCIEKDIISIPFGPVFSSDITESELIDFLYNIKKKYNLPLEFSVNNNFKILENNLNEIWDFSTIILELDDINILEKNFNENRRRIVKKTLINLKDSIISTDPSNAKKFYEIYCKRLSQTNGIVDFTFEELEHMLKVPNVKLNLCEMNNEPLGGILTFRYNDTLINRYNCTNPDFLKLNPNTYLDYNLIQMASKNPSLKYYDFSGFVEGQELEQKTINLNRYKLSYGPKKINKYKWYEL